MDLIRYRHSTSHTARDSKIPQGTFAQLHILIHLDLSYNGPFNINEHGFDGLSSIQILELSTSYIDNITQVTFAMVHTLIPLHLSSNYLTEIEDY